MPKNINSITINIFLEGIEKIKTEKNDKKNSLNNLKYILARKMRHNARQSDNNIQYRTFYFNMDRSKRLRTAEQG